jgi:glycosyltransferase involved in cell wall biosynthesis
VAVNPDDAERMMRWQGIRRDKLHVIAPGVDCQRFRFEPAGRDRLREAWGITKDGNGHPLVLGTAARLSSEKGIDRLIEATAMLRRRGVNLITVVAGEGEARNRLVALAREHNLADVVRFIPFSEDMPAFYSALDVVATTGRTESFGLTLAEGMACERAVVATPTSGSRWQIDHDRNGWQLQSFEPAELADAVLALADDPGRRQRLGQAGRESVERRFSSDTTLDRTLQAMSESRRKPLSTSSSGMIEPAPVAEATEDLA